MRLPSSLVERFFRGVEPFRSLLPTEIKTVSHSAQTNKFSRGETVFSEGESADSVWVLYRGRVQVFKQTASGKFFAIESLGPGEVFGTLCRLGGDGRFYPCTAVAAAPTVVLRLPDKVFLEYCRNSPAMIRGLCALCSQRLKDVQDLRCEDREPVAVRAANTLLRLAQVHGNTIPMTKREISELVGTALETTFRVISRFQKMGLLTSRYGQIRLERPDELKKWAEKA